MEELTKIKEVLSPAAGGAYHGAENEMRAETEPDLPRDGGGGAPFNRGADRRYGRFTGHQQADGDGSMDAPALRQVPLLEAGHEDSLEGLADQFQGLRHGFGGGEPD